MSSAKVYPSIGNLRNLFSWDFPNSFKTAKKEPKLFFDKIKKLCKENCRVVPFLPGCCKSLDYLIDYVPLKSIENYQVYLQNNVKTQYFSGDKASVFVFNI